jgi:hypothetical protein
MPGFSVRQRPVRAAAAALLALAACLLPAGVFPALAQTPPAAAQATPQAAPQAAPPSAAPTTQQATPQAAPEPPAPPAPAADPAEPSAAHVQAARELILATGISRSFQIIIPEFMDQIGVTLTQTRPELTNDLLTVMSQLKPEFDKQADEMIDLSARIYARLLTEDEIRAILAFFKSDAGRKYVGAQPLFLNQLVAGMQAWQQKISVNMMTRVREEMKKKGHDL